MIILRCIDEKNSIKGRLPFQCYTTKEKSKSYFAECCDSDFCNDNLTHQPGRKQFTFSHIETHVSQSIYPYIYFIGNGYLIELYFNCLTLDTFFL